MPKPCTFPTLYDKKMQLRISLLKIGGFLAPKQINRGVIEWSTYSGTINSLSICVNTMSEQPYIELNYSYKDEPLKYRIFLTSIPSSLNRGVIWYFICPLTKKRCRNLYNINGNFFHREAFKGGMYSIQTQSKKYRLFHEAIGAYLERGILYDKLDKKHFKKTYAGKPTKKYLKIMQRIQKVENPSKYIIEDLI